MCTPLADSPRYRELQHRHQTCTYLPAAAGKQEGAGDRNIRRPAPRTNEAVPLAPSVWVRRRCPLTWSHPDRNIGFLFTRSCFSTVLEASCMMLRLDRPRAPVWCGAIFAAAVAVVFCMDATSAAPLPDAVTQPPRELLDLAVLACSATAPGPSSCPGISLEFSSYVPGEHFGADFQSGTGTGTSATITITFSRPIKSVTITAYDPTFGGNAMLAFDSSGAQVGSAPIGGSGTPGVNIPQTVSLSGASIKSIQLVPAPRDYVAYGGLTFTADPESCGSDQSSACGPCESDVEITAEAKAPFKEIDATVPCPQNLGGGKEGLELTLSASSSLSPASCASKCKAAREIGGNASVKLHTCGLTSQGVSAGFTYGEDRQFGKTCNKDTCKEECDHDRSCISSKGTGTIALTTARTFHHDFTLHPPGITSIAVTALCDINLEMKRQLEFEAEKSSPAGLDPCEDCEKATLSYSLSGAAGGGCLIGLSGFGASFDFGCVDCVDLSAKGSLAGTLTTGPDCPTGLCVKSTITASGTLKTPEFCRSLSGYVVKIQASATATGSVSADVCTGEETHSLKATGRLDFTTKLGDACK
ncbi:MAG TPA: hypothetical protein VFT22_05120 [Kofleriaceae bacterium]|nr:hypothetical protein [Kofleriaceae bacterium]